MLATSSGDGVRRLGPTPVLGRLGAQWLAEIEVRFTMDGIVFVADVPRFGRQGSEELQPSEVDLV